MVAGKMPSGTCGYESGYRVLQGSVCGIWRAHGEADCLAGLSLSKIKREHNGRIAGFDRCLPCMLSADTERYCYKVLDLQDNLSTTIYKGYLHNFTVEWQ